MKKIFIILAILSLSYSHNMIEECDCGEGYYLDPSKNLCVVNPTLG